MHLSLDSSNKIEKLNSIIPSSKKSKTVINPRNNSSVKGSIHYNSEELAQPRKNSTKSDQNKKTKSLPKNLSQAVLSRAVIFQSIFDNSNDLQPFANLDSREDGGNKFFKNQWLNELGNLYKIDDCKKIIQGKNPQKIDFDITLTQSDTVISFKKSKKIGQKIEEIKVQEPKIGKIQQSQINAPQIDESQHKIDKEIKATENTINLENNASCNFEKTSKQDSFLITLTNPPQNKINIKYNQNSHLELGQILVNLPVLNWKFRENGLKSSFSVISNFHIFHKNFNQIIFENQKKLQNLFQDKTINQLGSEKNTYQMLLTNTEDKRKFLLTSVSNLGLNYFPEPTKIWTNAQAQLVKSYEFLRLTGSIIVSFLQQIQNSFIWQNFLLWGQIQSLSQVFRGINNLGNYTEKDYKISFSQSSFYSGFKQNFNSIFQKNLNLKYQLAFSDARMSVTRINRPYFSTDFEVLPDPSSNQFLAYLDNFWHFLKNDSIRDFWWLEIKVETRKLQIKFFRKLKKILNKFLFLIRRFYLLIFITLAVIGFNFGRILAISDTFANFNQSFEFQKNNSNNLNKVQFDTVSRQQHNSIIDFRSFNSQNLKGNLKVKKLGIKKIIAHAFQIDDSLSKLAELHNLSIATIRFNNQIANDKEPEVGKVIYIPWEDGYILHISEETSAEQIAEIYKLDTKSIIQTNLAFWNQKTGKFGKNNLLLLPTTDFEKITIIQRDEKNRIFNLKEADKQRQKMLNYTAVETKNLSKIDQKSTFIWPAVGSISRCLQPGHIACDIANFSAPPIFAVQDGVVSEAGWRDGGFGYMVVLDHGEGLQTVYMHMENVQVVKGQKLVQGQTIGKMGCTGNCSGTHLHFEVKLNKVQQNPLLYLY